MERIKKERQYSVKEILSRPRLYFKDAPAALGLSRTALIVRINDGRLPKPLKDGKLNYWPTRELLEHVENQDSQPISA